MVCGEQRQRIAIVHSFFLFNLFHNYSHGFQSWQRTAKKRVHLNTYQNYFLWTPWWFIIVKKMPMSPRYFWFILQFRLWFKFSRTEKNAPDNTEITTEQNWRPRTKKILIWRQCEAYVRSWGCMAIFGGAIYGVYSVLYAFQSCI